MKTLMKKETVNRNFSKYPISISFSFVLSLLMTKFANMIVVTSTYWLANEIKIHKDI